jgi:hypothetical protein
MYRPHSPSNAFLNINSQIIKKKKKKRENKGSTALHDFRYSVIKVIPEARHEH